MQLFYRAECFDYARFATRPVARLPRAINWRYGTPDHATNHPLGLPLPDHQPRAVNWRFQAAVEA